MTKKKDEQEMETLVEAAAGEDKKNPIDGVLASETQFKGNPMLVLKKSPDDQYGFQFGLSKAVLIREHIAAILTFLEKHGR